MKKMLFFFTAIAVSALFIGCGPGDKKERLDDIVKDLNAENYSLSFDKTYPEQGITKTSYGAESYVVYAEPEDVICGTPWTNRFPKWKIPVWFIPKIVRPTCPTMIPIDLSDRLKNVLNQADSTTFGGLKDIKLADTKNVLLANQNFTASYANLQPDMMDDSVLNNMDGTKYLLLQMPGDMSAGFTRDFYGAADLNALVIRKHKIDLGKIFKPKLIGCFDPQILTAIKEKLQRMNADVYKSLEVSALPQDAGVSVLSMH